MSSKLGPSQKECVAIPETIHLHFPSDHCGRMVIRNKRYTEHDEVRHFTKSDNHNFKLLPKIANIDNKQFLIIWESSIHQKTSCKSKPERGVIINVHNFLMLWTDGLMDKQMDKIV